MPSGLAALQGWAALTRCPAMRSVSALLSTLLGAMLVGCTLPTTHTTVERLVPVPVGSPPVGQAELQHIELPQGWSALALPGPAPGVDVVAFHRRALVQPARYQVLVIPGSGCTRWAPFVERYFAGLLHAQVVVLHKPHVDLTAGLNATCPPAFVATDSLAHWRDAAVPAVAALHPDPQPVLPQVLVGISEGAELLPDVAAAMSAVSGIVMVSASGLDPAVAGALQADRLGHSAAWSVLRSMQASDLPDDLLVQGRSLRYWRAFWRWPLTAPLLSAPWPLLRIWGDADESVPLAAYLQFNQLASGRQAPFCDIRLPGAGHGLQTAHRDGIQWLWSQLERWARRPGQHMCDVIGPHPAWGLSPQGSAAGAAK